MTHWVALRSLRNKRAVPMITCAMTATWTKIRNAALRTNLSYFGRLPAHP